VKDIAQESMKDAVKEAVKENGIQHNLTVALDGSWTEQK
jgi:hypothetical protein